MVERVAHDHGEALNVHRSSQSNKDPGKALGPGFWIEILAITDYAI